MRLFISIIGLSFSLGATNDDFFEGFRVAEFSEIRGKVLEVPARPFSIRLPLGLDGREAVTNSNAAFLFEDTGPLIACALCSILVVPA